MPHSGHEHPALVGPAAGGQLGGGLVRGQLHHRACHRRVLQHGAGAGAGAGTGLEGGLEGGDVPNRGCAWNLDMGLCVYLGYALSRATVDPRAPSSALLPALHLSSSVPIPTSGLISPCHFLLMSLLSCLTCTCPEASGP